MAEESTKPDPVTSSEETKPSGDAMAVDPKSDTPAEKPSGGDGPSIEKQETSEKLDGTPAITTPAADADVKMADGNDNTQEGKSETNGTSGAAEKKGDKTRRKSTGVPEHKTKKLNKKKSVAEFHTDAKPGELYLARMKGHAPWPSIIADDDMLPEQISKTRPVTAPNADGTWRRDDYAPGGKRHHERTFAIMFLHTNEFAWIPNGDLKTLTPEECKDVSEKSKSKALIAAFAEAAEGHDLQHYKGLLEDHNNALIEEEEAKAEREAEKQRKAERKARKSEANADDEMDIDDGAESKPKSKKRKKDAAADDDDEKPAKTPKTPKLKLSNPKTPATNEKSAKKKEGAAKSGKKKSAKAVVSSDDDTPADEEKPLTPAEKHEKLREEIRYCRHKLQRSLLSRDSVPTDDEVTNCEPWLKRLEAHPDLAADIITSTKIHKVLKAIIKLASIPKEEEFAFKKRSSELLSKWSKVLNEKPDDKEGEKKEATTNGETKAEPSPDAKSDDKPADDKMEEDKKDEAKQDDETKPAEKEVDGEKENKAETEKDEGKQVEDKPKEDKPAEPEASKTETESSKPVEAVEAAA